MSERRHAMTLHDFATACGQDRAGLPYATALVVITPALALALADLFRDLAETAAVGGLPYALTATWPAVEALLPEGGLTGVAD